MSCGTSFAKILLIIFNIIFWLSGAGLLGVGIWMLVDNNIADYLKFLNFVATSENLLQHAAYLFIAVGAFVLIVGFFGCCGAIKENRCMLGVYIFLLVLVMGLEIAGGVLAIVYKDKINTTITDELEKTFKKYYNNQTTEKGAAFTEVMNVVQTKLECCGIRGPSDYNNLVPSVTHPIHCCKLKPNAINKKPKDLENTDVADLQGCRDMVPGTLYTDPLSCCVLKPESKNKDVKTLVDSDVVNATVCRAELADTPPMSSNVAYTEGCEMEFKSWVETHAIILIGVGIGIACLELFGFIFAVCLCRSVQDDD